jgi:hypothetical protein
MGGGGETDIGHKFRLESQEPPDRNSGDSQRQQNGNDSATQRQFGKVPHKEILL